LTIGPKIFGGRRAPAIADGRGFGCLAAAARFRLKTIRHAAADLFTIREHGLPPNRNHAVFD